MVGNSVVLQLNNSFTAIRRFQAPAFPTMTRHHDEKHAGAIFMPSATARHFRLCREMMILPTQIRQAASVSWLNGLIMTPYTDRAGNGSNGHKAATDTLWRASDSQGETRCKVLTDFQEFATSNPAVIIEYPLQVRELSVLNLALAYPVRQGRNKILASKI